MSKLRPPKAKKFEYKREIHGKTLIDNYHWLRDETRKDPEVLSLIAEENKYTEFILEDSKNLKEEIFLEMIARYDTKSDENTKSTAVIVKEEINYTQCGEWLYWEKNENEDAQFNIRYRKKPDSEVSEIVLDLNEFSKQYKYFAVWQIDYSPDRKYMSIVVDLKGSENATTFIWDVDKKILIEELTFSGQLVWLSNSKAFFYESSDDQEKFRWCSVKKHTIGIEQKSDEIIHYEEDETSGVFMTVAKSKDGKFIYLDRTSDNSSEYWYMPYDDPDKGFKTFSPFVIGEQYRPFYSNGNFYVICNTDNAVNFKLMKTSLDKTEKQYWKEIIPHKEDTYFTSSNIWELSNSVVQYNQFIAFKVFQNGKQKIRFINTNTDEIKEIKLDTDLPFYEITLTNNEFNSSVLKFSIQSYSCPIMNYEFDLNTENLKFISQDKFKGFKQENYTNELVWASSHDGVKIPISLFYRKDLLKKDGSNPLFFEAYGAYGIHDYEQFDSKRLSIVDRGFIYGEAHVRGGGYLGKNWHLTGIARNRINRFKDYISCSEYLIKEKYTSSDKLIAYGRSAGGQIMGAILNMRPDLYKCVLAIVPGMDVVNAFYDKGWHLINDEIPEEGDIENKEDFAAMLERDMYYQIKPTNYPHVFATAALHDSRGYFWRPVKWFCKLREYDTGNNIQVLKTEDTGHWSGSDKYSSEDQFAELYAFVLKILKK